MMNLENVFLLLAHQKESRQKTLEQIARNYFSIAVEEVMSDLANRETAVFANEENRENAKKIVVENKFIEMYRSLRALEKVAGVEKSLL